MDKRGIKNIEVLSVFCAEVVANPGNLLPGPYVAGDGPVAGSRLLRDRPMGGRELQIITESSIHISFSDRRRCSCRRRSKPFPATVIVAGDGLLTSLAGLPARGEHGVRDNGFAGAADHSRPGRLPSQAKALTISLRPGGQAAASPGDPETASRPRGAPRGLLAMEYRECRVIGPVRWANARSGPTSQRCSGDASA